MKAKDNLMWACIQQAAEQSCLVCGKTPAMCTGVWLPTTAEAKRAVATPKGQSRVIVYSVCESCAKTPGILPLIEQIICIRIKRSSD